MITKAINAIKSLLPDSQNVTLEQIRNEVDFIMCRPEFSELDRDYIIRQLKTHYTIVVDGFKAIELDDPLRRKPWVAPRKANREMWAFWSRYKNYLLYKKSYAQPVVEGLDKLTDRILDGLYDPRSNTGFDKKGLVVGQVQSGKTSNYTGLVCKAADSGFNIIIVLTGMHNNLRSQTQLRIDEGFLGFDTQFQRAYNNGNNFIGVGVGNMILPAHPLTNSKESGDFSPTSGLPNFHSNEPIIAVVKKNSSVLSKLFQWMHNYSAESDGKRLIFNKSLLVIDDEADNASINTKKNPDERTAINDNIRKILELFAKNAYVGYTATPFANIFIPTTERNDLFPRDFIINIPPPSNYIGPEKVFGFDYFEDDRQLPSTVLPICCRVDIQKRDREELNDFLPSDHKKDFKPDFIPESLKYAIRCFIITCAIRKLRGQGKEHNSMLIHVTRFKKVQEYVKELVENEFRYYSNGIEMNNNVILEELRKTFERDAGNNKSYQTITGRILQSDLRDLDPDIQLHDWEEVKPFLYEAVVNTKVMSVNGDSKEVLDYYDNRENGLSVITVGGDKLSRGLTLEGLSVSYYLRASRMYDTLMQMGRWFGYRQGYVDLCRLFTTAELNEWFCHITKATQELREEFDYMADKENSTPEKYALKVRTHPGVLQISASNKIRAAVDVEISWAGRLVESYELKKDRGINESNLSAVKSLVGKLKGNDRYKERQKAGGTMVWYNVPPEFIIDMFRDVKVYDNLKAYNPENLIRFISLQLKNNELTSWRVALMSSVQDTEGISIEDLKVGRFLRTEDEASSTSDKYYITKSRIIDKRHEAIDLEKEEYDRALELTRKGWKKKDPPQSPSGNIIRNEIRRPKNPLLLIYLLDPKGTKECKDWETPFTGYAISFPASQYFEPVTYKIPETLLPFYNQDTNTLDYDSTED